ncbi:hypothetical protein [Methylobacterium oryzihabitans]|uniref:Bacteriophage tail tape measure N-terminal domain-containing protein n=1 Tax=Methylobacterium oryzihabitans TaxID=2499852 RepID=A0A3S2V9S9_9HYPH|nr:hypothetical protein [Methylobacterium oryzihabitans]RVU17504.1 hypothetical protein EOE48_14040 [Methylobacterium oryzihabitans]
MADPLTISFAADTSRAQSAITNLAASIVGNMSSAAVSMTGMAANMNSTGGTMAGLAQTASRAAAAVAGDARKIAGATVAAAAKEGATLQGIATAFTLTAATSQTAQATLQTGLSTTTGLVNGLANQIPVLKAALGGLIAFTALTTVLHLTAEAARSAEERLQSILKLAERSQAAGVGTTVFQSLLGQAKALRTEAATLEGYLTKARAAATVRQGENGEDHTSSGRGKLEAQVKAGNLVQADLDAFTGAGDQEARIRVVLDLIERLQASQRNLAAYSIADGFFGEDFESKLRNGIQIVGAMRQALDGLKSGDDGRIISPEEFALARQINAELEKSRRVLADALVPLQKDFADYQNQQLRAMTEFAAKINYAAAAFAGLYKYVQAVGDAITALGNAEVFQRIYDVAKAMGLGGMNGVVEITPEDRERDRRAAAGADVPLPQIDVPRDRSKPLPAKPETAKSGGAEAGGSDPVQTFINQLQKAAAALKAEAEAFKASNAEKLIAINLAKAQEVASQNGATLTDAQTEAIRQASQAASEYKDKLLNLEQAERQAAEAARYFGDAAATALGDAILDGKSLSDILSGLSRQLSRSALQALATGQGPLAGLLGTAPAASEGANAVGGGASVLNDLFKSAFGGFRAGGGPVQAGRAYTVGEIGRELFVPDRDGSIVPVRPAASGGGSAGASAAPAPVVVQMRVESPDVGGFLRSEAQVTAALARAVQRGTRSL